MTMEPIADFVLTALQQQGALIEATEFGFYDCVLPDNLAARLHLPAYVTLGFGDDELSGATRLYYGHPSVDELIGLCRENIAHVRWYANHVRLDKRGLADLARATVQLPRGRLITGPDSFESRQVFHYVQFNFRAIFLSDEKHESLTSVIISAQTNQAVPDFETVEHLLSLHTSPDWKGIAAAPLRWLPNTPAVSEACLLGLLPTAIDAATERLASTLAPLRHHAARYLELDRARLEAYYGDLQADLEK